VAAVAVLVQLVERVQQTLRLVVTEAQELHLASPVPLLLMLVVAVLALLRVAQ
jgi:hypothetical protein